MKRPIVAPVEVTGDATAEAGPDGPVWRRRRRPAATTRLSNAPETVLSNLLEKIVFKKTVFALMPMLFLQGVFEVGRARTKHIA